MLCENCHKNEATLNYTEIINGHKTEQHVCNQCASELGLNTFNNYSSFMDNELLLGNLLSTILGNSSGYKGAKQYTNNDVHCDSCKMTYSEFLKNGKFGCSNCINYFGKQVDDSLRRVHGSNTHTGKEPINYIKKPMNNEDANEDINDSINLNIDKQEDIDSKDNKDKQDYQEINNNFDNIEIVKEQEETKDIDKLQVKLNQAVKIEEYEEAARLRDKIKAIKKEKEQEGGKGEDN